MLLLFIWFGGRCAVRRGAVPADLQCEKYVITEDVNAAVAGVSLTVSEMGDTCLLYTSPSPRD